MSLNNRPTCKVCHTYADSRATLRRKVHALKRGAIIRRVFRTIYNPEPIASWHMALTATSLWCA